MVVVVDSSETNDDERAVNAVAAPTLLHFNPLAASNVIGFGTWKEMHGLAKKAENEAATMDALLKIVIILWYCEIFNEQPGHRSCAVR
mmetsp:Transcript_39126/g.84376  ORF Transcript_39126/g.84376 Transcript_39126/m.84376 type:complete len:88 (-) Transcript_39126:30-293(-)